MLIVFIFMGDRYKYNKEIIWPANPNPRKEFICKSLCGIVGPVETACLVAALVCCVGPSRGVKAFEKTSLLTSIAFRPSCASSIH